MDARLLTLNDAAWLHIERPAMPTHMSALAIFRPQAGYADDGPQALMRRWRQARSVQAPFNYRLKGGLLGLAFPAWDRLDGEAVDLADHLHHAALPKPGGERELGALIARLHSRSLDRRKPLWELYLIEGLAGGRFALFAKMHHALIDGAGALRMLEAMTVADPAQPPGLPAWSQGLGSAADIAAQDLEGRLRDGLSQATGTVATALALAELGWKAAQGRDGGSGLAPGSILNDRADGERRFAAARLDRGRLEAVAAATAVSVDDVVLALCSGALRRYLMTCDALPAQSLVALAPGGQASGGFGLIDLDTTESDPAARLAAIARGRRTATPDWPGGRPGNVDQGSFSLMIPYLTRFLLGVGLVRRPLANLMVSELQGPADQRYLDGAVLEALYPLSVVLDGQALSVTSMVHGAYWVIGFTGCRDRLPHMQRLARNAEDELAALEQAPGLAAAALS